MGESRERISRHKTTGGVDPSQFSPSTVAIPAQATDKLLKLVYTDLAPWTSHHVGDGIDLCSTRCGRFPSQTDIKDEGEGLEGQKP